MLVRVSNFLRSSRFYKREWFTAFHEIVGLYTDDTILRPIWVLELNKVVPDTYWNNKNYELEFVKELRYDRKPTKEEMLWAMSAYGLSRHDVVFVKKAYELDAKNN